MNSRPARIALHFLGCLIFLALPFLMAPGPDFSLHTLFSRPALRDFTGYALMIGYFYLNVFLLIPKLYFAKRFWLFSLITLGAFLLITFIPPLLISFNGFPMHGHDMPAPKNAIEEICGPMFFFHISHHLFLFIAVLFVSLTLSISNRWKQAEKEKLHAELSYLKSQINPHFLFNTLNSIYALALRKSNDTSAAVVKLSGLMRYVTTESSRAFVPLEKELNCISDYIELQKFRLGNTATIEYSVQGSADDKQVAPLLLIPFVENAFKYGVSPEEDSLIRIGFDITEHELFLKVWNRKVHVRHEESSSTGIGIENAKQRLELVYPLRHTLSIDNNDKEFSVFLAVRLVD
jgi:hypothetical protein